VKNTSSLTQHEALTHHIIGAIVNTVIEWTYVCTVQCLILLNDVTVNEILCCRDFLGVLKGIGFEKE